MQYILKFQSGDNTFYNKEKQAVIAGLVQDGFVSTEDEARHYPRVKFDDNALEIGFDYNWLELTAFWGQAADRGQSHASNALPFDIRRGPTTSYMAELVGTKPMQMIRTAGSIEDEFQHIRSELRSFYKNLKLPPRSILSDEQDTESLEQTVFNLARQANEATRSGKPGAVVIGEQHGAQSQYQFLIQNMERLKRAGADVLLLEHFFPDQNNLLQQFIESGAGTPMPPELDRYIEMLDHIINHIPPGESRESSFRGLLKKARELHMPVRGFETEAALFTQNGLAGEVDGKSLLRDKNGYGAYERMQFMNYNAYNAALPFAKRGGFPILLVGCGHASDFNEGKQVNTGYRRNVPGLASMLGTRSIAILDDPLPTMTDYTFVQGKAMVPIPKQIQELGESFSQWQKPYLDDIVMTASADGIVRENAFRKLSAVFNEGGGEFMEQMLDRLIKLRVTMAMQQERDPLQDLFTTNGLTESSVSTGVDIINSQGLETMDSYYAFKASCNHVPSLGFVDRNALIGQWPPLSWEESKNIVISAFRQMGYDNLASEILNSHTDTRKGNDINSARQNGEITVNLNPTCGLLDPKTAAHETGHAIQYALSGSDNIAPAVAEIVSVFSETLVMREMQRRANTPQQSTALLTEQLNTDANYISCAGRFQFEKSLYRQALGHPEEQLPVLQTWREAMAPFRRGLKQDKDSMDMADTGLMQSSHSVYEPGYGLAYLIAWAAAPQLADKIDAPGFQEKFTGLLKRGGEITAQDFLSALGLDITQPQFWQARIDKMQAELEELKQLYHENTSSLSKYSPPKNVARAAAMGAGIGVVLYPALGVLFDKFSKHKSFVQGNRMKFLAAEASIGVAINGTLNAAIVWGQNKLASYKYTSTLKAERQNTTGNKQANSRFPKG